VQIASFALEKKTIVNSYSTYTKGLDNILLIRQTPKGMLVKTLLKKDKIWFYFPRARKTITFLIWKTLKPT
jgi:hypothetical protein